MEIRQNDAAVLARLTGRLGEVLKRKHCSRGNTLRCVDAVHASVAYRLKATVDGCFMGLSKEEIKTHIRSLIQKEMQDTGKNVRVGLLEYEVVRNWWRGGRPHFYEDWDEDTFNCVIFLGLPLITRPIAYLYDRWFPRIRVKVWFRIYTSTS